MSVADQRSVTLPELLGAKTSCFFFVGTDCPISNAYVPEITRIVQDFQSRGVAFYAIYAMRDGTVESVAEHARSFDLPCPAILDSKLNLALALGATRMPEAVLLSSAGQTIYQGRIDDRYPAVGAKRREHPTSHDLRDALRTHLAGEPVLVARTQAVGCYLDLPKKDSPP